MGSLQDIRNALDKSKEIYDRLCGAVNQEQGTPLLPGDKNCLFFMDNKAAALKMISDKKILGKVQMGYIDPPFFTGVKQRGRDEKRQLKVAYSDVWKSREDYLTEIAVSVRILRDLICDSGALWVHLDWHAVHDVRLILDEVFGEENFVNEVIWSYKSGGASKKSFARKHDNILLYKKGSVFKFYPQKEKSYNRKLRRYGFKNVEEYRDEKGWYTLVNMKDVWAIDMVGRTSGERTGYATQKPEALLERIIRSCTDEGDMVCDLYGGSGTTATVSAKLGRRFLTVDSSDMAIEKMENRFKKENIEFVLIKE